MPDTAEDASKPGRQRQRIDARRNRQRIVTAALKVFGEHGVDAQMTDIAKASGLGIGTLYRNFDSKETLVNALVLDRVTGAARVVRSAAEEPDAWRALQDVLERVTLHQVENRVMSQFIEGRVSLSSALREQRDAVYRELDKIVRRARKAGQLRSDVNISDIRLIMTSLTHLASNDAPVTRRMVRRYISIVIDGLRAPGVSRPPGPPVSLADSEQMFRPAPAPADQHLRRGRRTWPIS